jgi:hypothetical protein
MPDFTIIDDGGDSRREDKELSQQFFEDFVVALLRSLASGDDPYRIVEQFFRFLKHAQQSKVPLGPVFAAAIRDLNDRAFPDKDGFLLLEERTEIVLASLRVIAERLANDDAARGRLSKRVRDLDGAIERDILAKEERSRDHGWSHLKNLAQRLGKRPKNEPPIRL